MGSAQWCPSRGGRVVARTPLLYTAGADPSLDRPAHVRAGSALAQWRGCLGVIQDDACFLAIIDVATRSVRAIPFPTHDRVRQFDDTRGNKDAKLDLEAVFVVDDASLLVALGSGSSPLRERILFVRDPGGGTPEVTITSAPELYAALRAAGTFSGSELNIEGAAVHGDDVVLFQRGNGAPRADRGAIDATARVALSPLLGYLRGEQAVPPLRNVIAWDLGRVEGARLTFTDAAVRGAGELAILACAEDSPDATHDGPVSAVAMGILDETARFCELGPILDERGAPLLDKAEGLAFDGNDPTRAYVVTDRDDPAAPSELLEIRLGEAWSR